MIAKVIVHAPTRAEAIHRMTTALARTVVLGITTNQKFLINVMNNARFRSGAYNTHFIATESEYLFGWDVSSTHQGVVAAMLFDWAVRRSKQVYLRNEAPNWRNVKWRNPPMRFLVNGDTELEIRYEYKGEAAEKRHHFRYAVDMPHNKPKTEVPQHESLSMNAVLHEDGDFGGQVPSKSGIQGASGLVRITIENSQRCFYIAELVHDVNEQSFFVHDLLLGYQLESQKVDRLKGAAIVADDDHLTPYTVSMPCRILKIMTPSGATVKKNEPLLSIESMKTEVKILSRHDGVVTIYVKENQFVDARALLCKVA